ncbi:MAG: hypothetical protein NVS3B7_15830 [Candidatus Elarobacter sp.]
MPLYDYQCRACRTTTEVRHGFREAYAEPCASCGGEMARVFNPAGIVFKGSGFYITDSRKPSASSDSPGSAPSTPAPAPAASADSAPKKSESSAA